MARNNTIEKRRFSRLINTIKQAPNEDHCRYHRITRGCAALYQFMPGAAGRRAPGNPGYQPNPVRAGRRARHPKRSGRLAGGYGRSGRAPDGKIARQHVARADQGDEGGGKAGGRGLPASVGAVPRKRTGDHLGHRQRHRRGRAAGQAVDQCDPPAGAHPDGQPPGRGGQPRLWRADGQTVYPAHQPLPRASRRAARQGYQRPALQTHDPFAR